MKKTEPKFLLQHSYLDVFPVLGGVLHFTLFIAMLVSFNTLTLWQNVLVGVIYSFSISWNISSLSHNFIHNPFFKSNLLNRCFSLMESLTLGFSQTMYDQVHRQHHIGNNDKQDANGKTVDWISTYRYGKNGQHEFVLSYAFMSFFRDDFDAIINGIKRLNPFLAKFSKFEVAAVFAMIGLMFIANWKLGIFYLVFMFIGHFLTSLNGYYEHFGSESRQSIAWGVSCYNKLFNFFWFNNGYHAEHHYRPKHHWTKMPELRQQILQKQQEAGVCIVKWPQQIGFLNKFSQ